MPDITALGGIGQNGFSSIVSALDNVVGTSNVDGGESRDFSSVLLDAMDNSEQLDEQTTQETLDILTGDADNLSDILINAQKSELAVNLTVQIRNKVMDAYKEIMNMQV